MAVLLVKGTGLYLDPNITSLISPTLSAGD